MTSQSCFPPNFGRLETDAAFTKSECLCEAHAFAQCHKSPQSPLYSETKSVLAASSDALCY